jgi:pyruvate kinase/thymidylate kinase
MRRVPEIMATIGPTLETPEDMLRAIEAGARWFRLPCGYRQRPHVQNAQCIRKVAAESGVPVQLLLDLPSSRPRTGEMNDLRLDIGARVKFWDPCHAARSKEEAGVANVPLPGLYPLLGKIARDNRIWFCDGRLEFLAEEIRVRGGEVLARLDRGIIPLKASNSIYLPDSSSPFTMITVEDRALLESVAAADLIPDWVALSMVSAAEDVEAGRRELLKRFSGKVRIMAKIETTGAVEQIDSILAAADGIMVARGDLGPAVDFIRLPEAQEELVAAARRAAKPVVVATQILEYFAEAGVPQRSELSGLALLAQQAPDAIMLGKETVFSPRPIECIRLARDLLAYETDRLEAVRRRLPRSLAASSVPPFVVAIEGPNGAGKSLMCAMLHERMALPGLRGVPAGWEDSALKRRMIRDADWLASAMYFLSGVIETSRQVVEERDKLQVMDRSLWSTLAAHYAHDPARLERLLSLVELAADRLKVPNLTIVLEASPETCRRRIAGKAEYERELDAASGADEDSGRREREFYRWLAAQGPKVVFVDAEGDEPEEIYRRVEGVIRESLPCCTW